MSQEDIRTSRRDLPSACRKVWKSSQAISERYARSAMVWKYRPRAANSRPRAARSKNFSAESLRALSAERDLPRRSTSRRDLDPPRRKVRRDQKRKRIFLVNLSRWIKFYYPVYSENWRKPKNFDLSLQIHFSTSCLGIFSTFYCFHLVFGRDREK